ncbi:MAG: ABC transporter permease [Candidatus Binatia bacterium]
MAVVRSLYQNQHRLINALAGIVIVMGAWHGLNRAIDNQFFLVGPWQVIVTAGELFRSGEIYPHLRVSGVEFVLGYSTAAAVGIAFGMAFGISRVVREFMDPWLGGLYATPTVALAPLIIVWFGVELTPKIIVVLVTAVIPIILNTYTGIINVGREFRMLASAFCLPEPQILIKIIVPGALPYIVTGLRLATSRAIVGVVVGEYFGSSEGLGWLLFRGLDTYNMSLLITCAVLLAGTGILFNQGILFLERRMTPWRETKLQE